MKKRSLNRRIPFELDEVMKEISQKNDIGIVEAGRTIAKIIRKDSYNKRKFLEEIKL